jgi:hypothetical protein
MVLGAKYVNLPEYNQTHKVFIETSPNSNKLLVLDYTETIVLLRRIYRLTSNSVVNDAFSLGDTFPDVGVASTRH